jgi:hypothetical protein
MITEIFTSVIERTATLTEQILCDFCTVISATASAALPAWAYLV